MSITRMRMPRMHGRPPHWFTSSVIRSSNFEADIRSALVIRILHAIPKIAVISLCRRGRAAECEQVFVNQPLILASDARHSEKEDRFFVLGQSDAGRELFLVFTRVGT